MRGSIRELLEALVRLLEIRDQSFEFRLVLPPLDRFCDNVGDALEKRDILVAERLRCRIVRCQNSPRFVERTDNSTNTAANVVVRQ